MCFSILTAFLLQKEYAWVEGFAATVRNPAVGKDAAAPNFFNAGVLGEVSNFLEFYQTRLAQIDEKSDKLSKKLKGTSVLLEFNVIYFQQLT